MKKNFKVIFCLALAIALCLSLTVSAFADVNGGTVTVKKYMVMDTTATVPAATFSFSLTNGTGAAATATTPEVFAGIGADTAITATAAFTPETATHNSVQTGDIVTLNNQKYAKVSTSFDLSGINYTAPGIYRYNITETDSTVPGITEDTGIVLDVYIGYADQTAQDNDTLSVLSTVLHRNATDAITTTGGDTTIANKVDGLTNTYATQGLTLSKTVTGNQGDRSKYFEFDVVIGGEGVTGSFTVDRTDANVAENPETITAGATGATFKLRSGESIVINGLPAGATYDIVEDKAASGATSYTTTIVAAGATTVSNTNATASGTMGDAAQTVAYTNNLEGVVPTGVILDIAPYAVMVMFALAAILFLTAKKRNAEN